MENIIGDNGKIIDTDWKMSEFGELMFMLEKMPKQDLIIKHYSQYTKKERYTGCTIMTGINNFATLNNYDFTEEEIESVYDKAKSKGWTPGKAWSRSEGMINIMQRWNEKFPNDKAMIFTDLLFSDAFNLYISKLGIAAVSINVDSVYWKDVRDNLKLDGFGPFVLGGGHATNMMNINMFKCIDSVTQNYTTLINTPMVYERGNKDKIKILADNHNMRKDVHIVIMERWLRGIDPAERIRLESMKKELEKAIEANSAIRHLTKTQEEKKERERMNNYNRAKLTIINGMLS